MGKIHKNTTNNVNKESFILLIVVKFEQTFWKQFANIYKKPLPFDSAILLLGNHLPKVIEDVHTMKQLQRKHGRLFRRDKNRNDLSVQW